jgi:DNA-directed RNA polymerase subunit RPC12/RpoP
MICPRCGKKQTGNPKFCRNCGARLGLPERQIKVNVIRCAYHPDNDATGICVNCGRFICAKCQVILSDKIYCNHCVSKLVVDTSSTAKKGGSAAGFVVGSIICAVIALLSLPPVFGIMGIVLGYFAYRRHHGIGIFCMILAAICMIVGIVLGAMLYSPGTDDFMMM